MAPAWQGRTDPESALRARARGSNPETAHSNDQFRFRRSQPQRRHSVLSPRPAAPPQNQHEVSHVCCHSRRGGSRAPLSMSAVSCTDPAGAFPFCSLAPPCLYSIRRTSGLARAAAGRPMETRIWIDVWDDRGRLEVLDAGDVLDDAVGGRDLLGCRPTMAASQDHAARRAGGA
jgi:hypothetical protein